MGNTKELEGKKGATAIALMDITRTMHPLGGATGLIAAIGGERCQSWISISGYSSGIGAVLILAVALLANNIPRTR